MRKCHCEPVTGRRPECSIHGPSMLRNQEQLKRRETLLEAARAVCDYCGGRARDWFGGDSMPYQRPNDSNWYHNFRLCKAAAIHTLLKQEEELAITTTSSLTMTVLTSSDHANLHEYDHGGEG
jgi:hypothetical protein